jgi:DnaK suppressor protein
MRRQTASGAAGTGRHGAGDLRRAQRGTPALMASDKDTVDLVAAEKALEDKQADLRQRLGVFTATPERGSNLGFGKRIGDGTIEAVDRLNQIGVGTRLESRLERVDRALKKLEEGTYGACDSCGRAIDPRRLRAAPESTVCVDCPLPPR